MCRRNCDDRCLDTVYVWVGLALIASLLSVWLRVSTALTEICVGTAAQLILGTAFGATVLGSDEGWIKFLAGIGAIMLTFLAGAELDPVVFKKKWKEATAARHSSASSFHFSAAPRRPTSSSAGT